MTTLKNIKQQPPQGKGEGDWSAERQRIENDKTLSTEQKEKAKIESTAKSYRDWETDRKSTRLNSSHSGEARMPSSA